MYPNLLAEMARHRLSRKHLADALNISYWSLTNKLAGRSPFRLSEAQAIRDKLFSDIDLGELFAKEAKSNQKAG
jgi:hypothetical protein